MAFPQRFSDAIHIPIAPLIKIELEPTTLLTSTTKPTSIPHTSTRTSTTTVVSTKTPLDSATIRTSFLPNPINPTHVSTSTATSTSTSHSTSGKSSSSATPIIYIIILFLIIIGTVAACLIKCCWCRGRKQRAKGKKARENDAEQAQQKQVQSNVANGLAGFAGVETHAHGYGYAPRRGDVRMYPVRGERGMRMAREEGPRWPAASDIVAERGWEGNVRPGWEGRPL